MALEEDFFQTTDGEKLFYRFQPAPSNQNPILIVHGHGEHSGRYLKFFTHLKDLQVPLATFDLRGSGRSSGPRVYVSRFEDYLNDLSDFIRFLKIRHGVGPPIRLVGHSLGGLIATAWAHQNREEISKLILSSPLFGIPMGRILKALVNLLNRFTPRLVIRNPVKPLFLTHDPEEVERYKKDPLIQRQISVRLVHEMLRYISILSEESLSFPFPVYILMAQQDFIVNPDATRKFSLRVQAPDKELESFPGFFHEIVNEKGQEKAFERLRYYLVRSQRDGPTL